MSPFGADLELIFRCGIVHFGTNLEPNWACFGAFSSSYKARFKLYERWEFTSLSKRFRRDY